MSESDQPYQVMPDLDEKEYQRLKSGIRENGIEYPIIVDGDGEIIDGHHRYQAWLDLDRDPDEIPTRLVDDTDTENYHRAYRTNLNRRDLTDGTKREVVKQYLLEHPDRVTEDTQQAIAEDLGVSRETVRRAVNELERSGKLTQVCELNTDEKRERVREYVEDNPPASDREVAREVDCDVSHVTVGKWRDEWDIEEPATGLDTFTNSGSEADKAQEVVDAAKDEEADDEVQQVARENAERLDAGNTSPTTASKNVEKVEADKAVEAERDPEPEHQYQPTVEQADATEWLDSGAWGSEFADVLVTDPPFATDVSDIERFARGWLPAALQSVAADGYAYIFVGSYAHELRAYLNTLTEFPDWHVQPLVWNYRNTLGKSPDSRYKRDWQAVLYCRGPHAGSLNAPKTSELRSVQRVNAPGMPGDDSERHHKWQKPKPLVEQYIRHATDRGDLVIDPFAGSGEVLLTAADVGRRAAGCDIEMDAVSVAVERGCVLDE